MRFLGRSLTGLFLLGLTLALLAWAADTVVNSFQERAERGGPGRGARERVFAANVVTITPGVHTPKFTAFGQIRSRRTLDIRATSGGKITFLAPEFQDGGRVETGQLMLTIDPANATDALWRARTDVAEAEAEQRDAERALELAKGDLAAALTQAELRDGALARQQDLKQRGVGTDAAVETAALAASSAQQSIVSRQQALASAEGRVEVAVTSLARQKLALTEAERVLTDTEIRAGFDGALENVTLTQGGIVTTNEQLARLIDPTDLEVSFRVSIGQYSRLLDGQGALADAEVTVVLDVLDFDLQTTGKITRESASVETGQTGRLLFAEMSTFQGFRPGDFVTVVIQEPALSDVALVPATAIDADGSVLVVGDQDRLERASITVLRRQDDLVLISAPELAGREIVAERSPLLGAGIKIRPIRPVAPGTDTNGTTTAAAAPSVAAPPENEMIALSDERRAKLIEFVEGNKRMPADAKKRILGQLEQPEVPKRTVDRLEQRMGG